MRMITCPHCQPTEQQVKTDFIESGSQRYLWKVCHRKYTFRPLLRWVMCQRTPVPSTTHVEECPL
jgi:hypothetical protein